MVEIEGKTYEDDAPVAWDVAERVGGFYFSRARFLGCPPPPAVFVADSGDFQPDRQQLITIGRYHEIVRDAEDKQITGF